MSDWLSIRQGAAPLVVTMPHGGTWIPADIEAQFASPWHARKDTDWCICQLYAFAAELDATIIATTISRSIIDVNRDPSGASLYPGQATTALCPTTTFDGEPLYRPGAEPDPVEIEKRKARWFVPYHAAIEAALKRLRARYDRVVLYDAHSIRSHVPRLFDGTLPLFNIGTNDGKACIPQLRDRIAGICKTSGQPFIVDGRFKGGWTTRYYGQPAAGVDAVQMELAMRGYLEEPADFTPETWPAPLDPARAAQLTTTLRPILQTCLDWTRINHK